MIRLPPLALPPRAWLLGALAGVGVGTAAVAPLPWVLGGAGVLLGGTILVRAFPGAAPTEWVVAAYWVAFCLFTTMLRDYTFGGLFYPFYLALFLGAVVLLVAGGLRVDATIAWAYVLLLLTHVASLAGSPVAMDAAALDRLVVVPFGALVLLQFRSPRGVRLVTTAAIVAALAVSAWVVVRAIEVDFAARAALDVNQNVASFYVCIGLLASFAGGLHPWTARRGRAWWVTAGRATGMAVMAYALVLLASRGMIIALALALAALLVRAALLDRRSLAVFAVLLVVVPAGLLLPGGLGIVERFEDPTTATGGGRTMIWAAVVERIAASSPAELLVGHGFESSRAVVERRFAPLGSTHNGYLQVVYDLGLVGFAAFLALHARVLVAAWRDRGRHGAIMAGVTIFLLTANMAMSAPDSYLYWTALGLLLAMATFQGRPAPGATP